MSATENIDLTPWMMGCVYWEALDASGFCPIETQVSDYINRQSWRYVVDALPDEDFCDRWGRVMQFPRWNLHAFIEPRYDYEFDDEDAPLRF